MATTAIDPLDAVPAWERVSLRSVGVDIGSATSQIIFSDIVMAKIDGRFVPVERRVTYRSPVLLTPYLCGTAIDQTALLGFIEDQFRRAGAERDDIDCGAVILTGTALDRDNARIAADLFAARSGRFVTVSAGDALEATLAAHGSGAVDLSRETGSAVLNIDIGGGTTKFAACTAGRIVATAAIDVGARLVVVDDAGVVVRLENAARYVGGRIGLSLSIGAPATAGNFGALAAYMVDQIWAAARLDPNVRVDQTMMRTAPLPHDIAIDTVVISGGVAEFLTGRIEEPTSTLTPAPAPAAFGDLGIPLSRDVARRLSGTPGITVAPASAGIRSTVLGAALFTVQVSGDTIYVSRPGVLPLRDVPVIAPDCTAADGERDIAAAVSAAARGLSGSNFDALAVAVRWKGNATLDRLTHVTRGLVAGLAVLSGWSGPLVLVCDDDVGRLLGRHVQRALPGYDVVSLDGIELRSLDFIDIAGRLDDTPAVPVTVKSLVFGPS